MIVKDSRITGKKISVMVSVFFGWTHLEIDRQRDKQMKANTRGERLCFYEQGK